MMEFWPVVLVNQKWESQRALDRPSITNRYRHEKIIHLHRCGGETNLTFSILDNTIYELALPRPDYAEGQTPCLKVIPPAAKGR